MKRNPELDRQLWLSPPALWVILLTPIFILLCAIAYLSAISPRRSMELLMLTSLGFASVAVPAGGYLAGLSLEREFRDRTWDWQRLSALEPLELGLGKLFGATTGAWYALALGLATAWAAFSRLPDTVEPLLGRGVALSYLLVAATFAVQALTIASLALSDSTRAAAGSQMTSSGSGVVLGLLLLTVVSLAVSPGWEENLTWYGLRISVLQLTVATMTGLVAWCAIFLEWSMRVALRSRPRAWVLPALMGSVIVWAAGLVPDTALHGRNLWAARAAVAAALSLFYVYGGLAIGRSGVPVFGGWLRTARERRLVDLARITPGWMWGALALAISAIALYTLAPPVERESGYPTPWTSYGWVLHALAVVARDIAIWLAFAVHPRFRVAANWAFLCFGLIHVGLILFVHVAGMDVIPGLISFTFDPHPLQTGVVLATAGALFALARGTWTERIRDLTAT